MAPTARTHRQSAKDTILRHTHRRKGDPPPQRQKRFADSLSLDHLLNGGTARKGAFHRGSRPDRQYARATLMKSKRQNTAAIQFAMTKHKFKNGYGWHPRYALYRSRYSSIFFKSTTENGIFRNFLTWTVSGQKTSGSR